MKIYELLCETTEHDTDIVTVANVIADYIANDIIPYYKKLANDGEAVSNINNAEVDYFLLSGYPMRNGYINTAELPENIVDDYYIPINKMSKLIKNYKGLDKDVVNIILKLKLYFSLSDNNNEAIYYPESNEIMLMLNKIFSSKNVVDENKVASLIAHEMRHALDNHVSKGNIFKHDDRKLQSADGGDDDEKHQAYLRLQSEGNARFTQAAKDIIAHVKSSEVTDINEFKVKLKDLTTQYALMTTDKKKFYKNFMKRAYKIYDHLRNDQ